MKRHAACLAHAGAGEFDFILNQIRVDHPGKTAVFAVVVPYLTPVGLWSDQHRTVRHICVVQHNAYGQNVVVGVRVESPILVPFNR